MKKKYLATNGYMLNRVLEKIKLIKDIETINHTKTFIDTDNKIGEKNALRNAVILTSCVINFICEVF